MDWSDNPFFSADEVERLSSTLSRDELENRKFGRFSGIAQSLVYSEFDERVHVVDPFPIPFDWQENISIDPGLSNPLSAHFYAVDYDGNIYVVAEHYDREKDIEFHSNKIHKSNPRLFTIMRKNSSINKLSTIFRNIYNIFKSNKRFNHNIKY